MLIASYLNNREFTTLVNTAESRPKQVNCGVPQESLLGPLLYILYTKGIEKIVLRHNLKVHMYADDVQIYGSFGDNEFQHIQIKIQLCLNEIKQ